MAAFAVLPLLVALAGRIRSGGVRTRCRGRPGATSARRLISRLSRSMGLLRPDLGPVLPGEGGERGQVRLGVDQHLGDSEGKASLRESMTCLYWAMTAS